MAAQKYTKVGAYYFMRTGGQGIIWLNAVVFVVGHILWFLSLDILAKHASLETLVWSKY